MQDTLCNDPTDGMDDTNYSLQDITNDASVDGGSVSSATKVTIIVDGVSIA